jgi:hypothetical protein
MYQIMHLLKIIGHNKVVSMTTGSSECKFTHSLGIGHGKAVVGVEAGIHEMRSPTN